MFGFGKKKNINVEYVEAGKRHPMSTAKVPTDSLPESYQVDSVMEFKGKKWTIVAAVPDTKEEFAKSGKLQLFLSQVVELVPPGDSPFALPTINDEIGIVRPAEPHPNVFVVHEDDWRQMEFVSRAQAPKVQQELQQIRKILETQGDGSEGYKRIHIRKSLPQPLGTAGLPMTTLKESFGIMNTFEGLVITGYSGQVEGGFALDVGGAGTLWGETDGRGNLLSLNLAPPEGPGQPVNALPQDVAAFCTKHKLQLVDWPRAKALPK